MVMNDPPDQHGKDGANPPMTTVRLFGDEDFTIVSLLEEGENGAPYPAAVFIRQASELYPRTFFVAESGPSLAGYIIGAITEDCSSDAWILRLRVAPPFRQRRIGSALLQVLITTLRDRGVTTIRLSVAPANTPALALYRRHGFEVIAARREYFGKGEDRFIMLLSP